MEKMSDLPELHEFFENVDHADIKSIDAERRLRAFIAGMLSYYPPWLVLLYKVRQILVALLGLARHEGPDTLPSFRPEDIPFAPEERISFFIVKKAQEDRFWVAETPEDKHLKAYVAIDAQRLESGATRFRVATTVRYLHWTGPVYFNLIRPFHHLVVWEMMKAGVRITS